MARRRYRYFDPRALARLGKLNLVARGVVEGFMSGLHRSPFKGFSVEFAEHRPYVPGDALKHIDWRSFARTERLTVKEFEDETNVRCYLLLDASASMGYRSEGVTLTKLEYACFLCATFAYLMIKQQDPAGIVVFDRAIRRYIAPRSSPEHLRILLEALEETRAGQKTRMAEPFHELAETIKKRALIIIISDLYDDEAAVMRALRHFRHRKHEVLLFHLLDPTEADFPFRKLSEFKDLESGDKLLVDPRYVRQEYLKQLDAFCAKYRRECSESGADYSVLNTGTPYEEALGRYLALRAMR
jgi:uncharacterized protein (DUF58 family)